LAGPTDATVGAAAPDPRRGPSAQDEAALARCAAELADAVEAALPGWVLRGVVTRAGEAGLVVDDTLVGTASVAGRACASDLGPRVRALLALDADDQRGSPLALLRGAVVYPSRVLSAAGVPPSRRDEFAERSFPDDAYDLAPATFADIDPSLHDPGIMWGAAKAHVHLARRRAEGLR